MITTVCMNPSVDKTARLSSIKPGSLNLLSDVRYDIGGKGINVAIVLQRLGVACACVGCVGSADEGAFLQMIAQEKLPFHVFSLPGKIRTNLKILETDARSITEFNEHGLEMNEKQLAQFILLLQEKSHDSEYVVFSGRLPVGCPASTYQLLMHSLPKQACVLDATGDALLHGIKEKPLLVKPNLPEMEAIVHKQLRTLRSIRDAAMLLMQYGAQNVIVSMGKYGAMYCNGKQTLFAPALQVDMRSTVGAGDAMIAGVLTGLSKNEDMREAFRYGVAAGAASVMTEGTQALQIAEFDALLPKVTVQEV